MQQNLPPKMQNNLGWEGWMWRDCSSSQIRSNIATFFFFLIYILSYPLIFLYTELIYHRKTTKIEDHNKLPGTTWQDSLIKVCFLLYQPWRCHHRYQHVWPEMESCLNTGLVYCPHCQEFVSRSTFRRHQLLWVEKKRKQNNIYKIVSLLFKR